MGLLDDAIKEHLDLKRRRGADPTEVERAEREALGPVRRGPEEPLVGVQPEAAPVAYEEEYSDDEYEDADDGWEELTDEHAAAPAPAASAAPAPAEFEDEYEDDEYEEYDEPAAGAPAASAAPPPLLAPEPPRAAPGELRFTSDQHEPDDDPLPHAAPADPAAVVRADEGSLRPEGFGETVEYDVERAMEAEQDEEKSKEDLLEETPEFLQDTPDHDRLWFEQRPPRDFNFDG